MTLRKAFKLKLCLKNYAGKNLHSIEGIKKETLPVHGQKYCNCGTNAHTGLV